VKRAEFDDGLVGTIERRSRGFDALAIINASPSLPTRPGPHRLVIALFNTSEFRAGLRIVLLKIHTTVSSYKRCSAQNQCWLVATPTRIKHRVARWCSSA
jgi:hypothetical protein